MTSASLPRAFPGWSSSTDGWAGTTATARGSAHRAGQPNQDAADVVALPDGGIATAVADGHGGASYGRSDVGARLAVRCALAAVTQNPDEPLPVLFPAIVAAWREATLADAAVQEEASDGATPVYDRLRPYGTTLLLAVARDGRLSLAQLGDGDIVVRSEGSVFRPVPGDARLVADVTTSLCLPSAVADVRYADLTLADEQAELILLATDGLGKSFEDARWWATTAQDYAALLDRLGSAVFHQRLGEWLEDSALVAGDDATVALLHRDPGVPHAGWHEAMTSREAATDDDT